MNTDEHRFKFLILNYLRSSAFICGSIFFLAGAAPAQDKQGLDAIGDDALMNELATRGLNTLLDRAFDLNKVPPAERQGRRTLLSLAKLSDPSAKVSSAQRQQLIAEVVKGIEAALPAINDPNLLMRQAFVLITQGVERDVNTLEYWGENPRTQAALRPVVTSVIKILARAEQLARAQADQISNKITSATDPDVARYDQVEKLAATAEYTRNMVAYYLALSLDSVDPQRKKIAGEAIDYLQQYDVAENPDRGLVRNRMAKLSMTAGDFAEARTLFSSVINDSGNPKPPVAQQYEARYFMAVADLLDKKPQAAEKGLNDLLTWQEANLPQDKTARDGAAAAAAMLRYRIQSIQAQQAKNPSDKKKFDDAAVATLMDLLAKRPDLRSIISEQLLPKLSDTADLTTVEPLLLRALVSRGEQELQRSNTADSKVVQRAADAANEIIRRKTGNGIDQQTVSACALLMPFFLERLDRKADAANAFVDYAQQYKVSDTKNATLSLDHAQSLIGQLRANPYTREDSGVTNAYERFLPLAIAEPFNRKEFAFEYARRLQLNNKPKEAIEYYKLVRDDDKRAADARYLSLVAVHDLVVDEPAKSAQRPLMLIELQKLADQVNAAAQASLASAKSDADKNKAKSMLARTSLLAADLARREQKDPQRALSLLTNFEQTVSGLPDSDKIVNEVMYIRVQSYMALAKYTDATEELVKLLNKTEGGQGAQIVYNLLEKLNADFDRAQINNDRAAMKTLSQSRAELSGFLVKWAEQNKDEKIKKFTYRYKVFDAETQRRAAELEDDPPAKEKGMRSALERFKAMQSPENLALYKESLTGAAAQDPNLFDPQVAFAIALIQYDLGDFEGAATELSRLLAQRKLGTAVITTEENGQEKVVDNDQYWEAILKLIQCDMKLNQHVDEAKSYLKQQYVTWGNRVGGKKWKAQYEALRAELIPEFKPEDLMSSSTATEPTTQP